LHDDVILPLAIESKGISPSPSSSNGREGDDNIWEIPDDVPLVVSFFI
jgi:hypothetical protein